MFEIASSRENPEIISAALRLCAPKSAFPPALIGCLEALKAGEKQSFDFEFDLPANSPPSLKFDNNHVKWNVIGRVDIPSWPDWTKTLPLIVSPNKDGSLPSQFGDRYSPRTAPPLRELTQADEAWFG